MSALTLASLLSRCLPVVESSVVRHARDSSSPFLSSFCMQPFIMDTVIMFSLKSSPMNFMLPTERRRALHLASSSSSAKCSRSSSCQGRSEQNLKWGYTVLFQVSKSAQPQHKSPFLTSLAASNPFCFFLSISSSRSLSNSSWQRLSSTLWNFTLTPRLSAVRLFSWGRKQWECWVSTITSSHIKKRKRPDFVTTVSAVMIFF